MSLTNALLLATGTTLIEVAMIIFVAVFVIIVVWVLLAAPRAFHAAAQIPLDEQAVHTPRRTTPTPPEPQRSTRPADKEETS